MNPGTITHRKINDLLNVIAIVLAVYVMIGPWIGNIQWWVKHEAPLVSNPSSRSTKSSDQDPTNIPSENKLVIPALEISSKINSGSSVSALNDGVWHRPNTGNPGSNNNMVIAGHRFIYGGRSVFYHLDKLKLGDEITVYWNKKPHYYKVNSIKEVTANDQTVEAPRNYEVLTLYTCTPLWSAENRLVITASPLEEN